MILRFLHLSDFHIAGGDDGKGSFDWEYVTNSMVDFIGEQVQDGLSLDFIAVTGDVAFAGKDEDYKAAQSFMAGLRKTVSLDPDRLFIVPGNHDVDRKKIKQRHIDTFYAFAGQDSITETLEDEDLFPILMRKFRAFNGFSSNAVGKQHFSDTACHFTETLHLTQDDTIYAVNILGLNSAVFAGYDGDDDRKLALGIYQVDAALKSRNTDAHLSIALFHHPFSCHHSCDVESRNRLTRECDLILTGHCHEPENLHTRYSAGETVIIQAGAAYEKRNTENAFNIVEIDMITGEGRVQFYKYLHKHHTWKKNTDLNWDQDGGIFSFRIRNKKFASQDQEEKAETLSIGNNRENHPDQKRNAQLENDIRDYCEKAKAFHETLPMAGFKTKVRVPIRIEDIYVPLRAMVHLSAVGDACFADSAEADKLCERMVDNETRLFDAFRLADDLERSGLVILGDPGSGKTTHLKRLLLYCHKEGPEKLGLDKNMIPVFLPLRELADVNMGLDDFIQGQLTQPHLNTPEGFGRLMLERGNLLLLLDGLDEVADPKQRAKVSRWIEDALKIHHRSCRFVVTCRFAGYTEKARLDAHFLEMHVRPLDREQAETFIHNWYGIVEKGLMTDKKQAAVIAGGRAENLIERLKEPEFRAARMFEMTRNPLLLANLCLVHRDRGDLPRSRAKLYEECIDVLLERWKQGIGIQTRVTAESGRRVLQPAAYWMHQEDGRTRAKAEELYPLWV